jgi:hypothetical protein
MNAVAAPLCCPVCKARFRGSAVCSRCRTDLRPMMNVLARAWASRQRGRCALRDGDANAALRWFAAANRLRRDQA